MNEQSNRYYWDKMCQLPRYAFLLTPEGNGVKRVITSMGNHYDVHDVERLIDEMQSEINDLRNRLNQPRVLQFGLGTQRVGVTNLDGYNCVVSREVGSEYYAPVGSSTTEKIPTSLDDLSARDTVLVFPTKEQAVVTQQAILGTY